MPLQVQLLPTSVGDRSGLQPLTTFVINGTIAIDAGSLGLALMGKELADIRHVVITHSHLDHIASLPMAIASSYGDRQQTLNVYATDVTMKAVRDHLFNGPIWPDFAQFPLINSSVPSMAYVTIDERQSFELDGIRFTPVPVKHEVPTIGLLVESADATLVFTSDTTCTDEIWQAAARKPNIKAVFIDCSFPDEMEQLALDSGHLTPALVAREVAKLPGRPSVYCVHIKPEVRDRVLSQLLPHRSRGIEAMEVGRTYQF